MSVAAYVTQQDSVATGVNATGILNVETSAPVTNALFFRNDNGNWVGADGYVVPKNFAEFIQRFPRYIHNWTRRQCIRMKSIELADDLTSELYIHMMTLPEDSDYRKQGCTDRIQVFNPAKDPENTVAMKTRFDAFVNRCLVNYTKSQMRKRNSDPVQWGVQIGTGDTDDATTGRDTEEDIYALANEQYRISCAHHNWMNAYVLCNEFAAFVKQHDPQLIYVLYAVATEDLMADARRVCGLSIPVFTRARQRLRILRACFQQKKPVPRWKQFTGVKLDEATKEKVQGL